MQRTVSGALREATGKVQSSSGFSFWSLFLWEQLLQVGNGAARVHDVTARLCEKEAAEPQCVVLSFKAAWSRGYLKNAFFLDVSFWVCSSCMDSAALKV